MSRSARRAATRELKAADKALAALESETDQTPAWYAANRRVDAALQDPALPDRHRDPEDH